MGYLYLGKVGDGYWWVLKGRFLYVRDRRTRRSRYAGKIATVLSFMRGGAASLRRAVPQLSKVDAGELAKLLEALKRLALGVAIDLEAEYTWGRAQRNREVVRAARELAEMGIEGQPLDMLYQGIEKALRTVRDM